MNCLTDQCCKNCRYFDTSELENDKQAYCRAPVPAFVDKSYPRNVAKDFGEDCAAFQPVSQCYQ